MHGIQPLLFANLLFTGLLAGFEIGVHYGLAPPVALSDEAQIRLRQAMVLRLRVLAPAIFFPALGCTVALAIRDAHAPGFWLRAIAVGALVLWIVIRAVRTVPVNSTTLEWDPAAPPEGWQELIERTERFHVVAAWVAVLAFVCSLASALQGS